MARKAIIAILRTRKIGLVGFIWLLILPFVAFPAEVLELRTEGGTARLTLAAVGTGFGVESLEFGSDSFFCRKGAIVPLWKLVFGAGVKGDKKMLSADKVTSGVVTRTRRGVDLVWRGIDLEPGDGAVDVVCGIVTNAVDSRYEFTIRVNNRSRRFGLFSTDYPRLPSVVRPGSGSVILPVGNWGAQRHRQIVADMSAIYPSYRGPFQFCSFERDSGEGLMMMALDGHGSLKYINVTKEFEASILTPAPHAGEPGAAYAPTFGVALCPYRGAWWPAAKIYRKWVVENADWTKKGPIVARDDFSQAMRHGRFWMLVDSRGEDGCLGAEKHVERTLGRLGGRVPLAVHWYCWHKHNFDTLYPDFFPARTNFADVVRRLTSKDVLIIPYVNGRIWDVLSPEYPKVADQMCSQENGEPYYEVWSRGRKFAAVCPTSQLWHDRMVGIGDRLVNEYGVNGFYYDQIASMYPVVCYATNHRHAPGGGTHWLEGYQKILKTLRAHHPGMPMTSENFSETYIDLNEGFLTWSPNVQEDLPAIPAIYSGYLVTMACSATPDYTIEAFRAVQGRSFLWGCQGGWLREWILEERQRDKFDYLVKLAVARQGATDYFSDGELIGDVANRAEMPHLKLKWKRWSKPIEVEMPAVQATRWRNPAGEELVAVVNYSSEPQRFDGGPNIGACDLEAGDVRLLRLETSR